jgi:glycine cleavage system H lipoate-binding protein
LVNILITQIPGQYAPVSGVIKEVNEKLNDQPGLLNKSPEGDGELHSAMAAVRTSS